MRGSISKIPYRPTTIAASFSTAGGRGRGAAAPPTNFQFTVDDSNHDSVPHGHGRGRGGSSPVLPPFSSFVNNNASASGRGRGFVPTSPPGERTELKPDKPNVKKPFLFVKEEEAQLDSAEWKAPKPLPSGIFGAISGTGRGKPTDFPAPQSQRPNAEIPQPRAREQRQPTKVVTSDTAREQLSSEEKVRKAVGILSREREGGPGDRGVRGEGREGGPGDRGVRAESRERVDRGRGRGRGGGRETQDDRYGDSPDEPTGQYFGDPADEEKVAQKLGPEIMSKLAEGFEETSSRVLPSPADEALLDAYETNLMIECEPEYFMEEFGTNPDIDEKPPIPLRDALEKMKPFLMAYEGIQSQEEWEEIMEETMKNVPLMKEIVDHYGGPDRATAKQQNEELERVAKTLPASTPASVKRFTDRAVLSLQSNPGWGFDKKCQFMDKLVMEVSQQYK